MPSLIMLPGKFELLDFYNSPHLYKHTFQVTFSTYFIFSGAKKLFQAKLGVQTTATVSPQRSGGKGEHLTLLLFPPPPAVSFSVSPHRDVLHTDFLFYPLTFV